MYHSDVIHNGTPLIAPKIGCHVSTTPGVHGWWPEFKRRDSSDRGDLPARTTITVATIYVGRWKDGDILGRDQVSLHRDEYFLGQTYILIGHQQKRERFSSGLFDIHYSRVRLGLRYSSNLLLRVSGTGPGRSCRLLYGSQIHHARTTSTSPNHPYHLCCTLQSISSNYRM